MERIRLAALAVKNIDAKILNQIGMHTVTYEEAAELWAGGFRPTRFTRTGYGSGWSTWFTLSTRIDGVEVTAYTENRAATAWEIEAELPPPIAVSPAVAPAPPPKPVPVTPPSTSHFGWLEID